MSTPIPRFRLVAKSLADKTKAETELTAALRGGIVLRPYSNDGTNATHWAVESPVLKPSDLQLVNDFAQANPSIDVWIGMSKYVSGLVKLWTPHTLNDQLNRDYNANRKVS